MGITCVTQAIIDPEKRVRCHWRADAPVVEVDVDSNGTEPLEHRGLKFRRG